MLNMKSPQEPLKFKNRVQKVGMVNFFDMDVGRKSMSFGSTLTCTGSMKGEKTIDLPKSTASSSMDVDNPLYVVLHLPRKLTKYAHKDSFVSHIQLIRELCKEKASELLTAEQ